MNYVITSEEVLTIADRSSRDTISVPVSYLRSIGMRLKDLEEGAQRLTPEDIGMELVSDAENLDWPWYRYPQERAFQPYYGVREVPVPDKSDWSGYSGL